MLYSGFPHHSLRTSNPLCNYVLALLLPVAALVLSFILWRAVHPAVFLFFFVAVCVAAWEGGLGPGIFAGVVSAILADYFLEEPVGHWSLDLHSLLRTSIFLLCCALISWMGDRRHRTQLLLLRMNSKLAHANERVKLALSAVNAFAWHWESGAVGEHTAMRSLELAMFHKEYPGTIHPEDRARFEKCLSQQIKEPASFELEYRVVGSETRWLRTKGQAITASREGPYGMVGLTFDITREKQAEETLRRSERLAMMGQLAATVAHEINNPLESISSLIHLANTTAGVPPSAKEYLTLAMGEVERLSNISRNTLGVCRESRVSADVTVGKALSLILDLYRKKACKRGVRLLTCWNEGARFRGSVGELQQIVANLVSNAIDAAREGGTIRVRVRESVRDDRPGLLLAVADDGPGIPTKCQQQVFKPFFTTKQETGTGLGLWVTQQLVNRANGDIRLKTSVAGPHRGTTFAVFLPTVHCAAERSDAALQSAAS